MDIRPGQPSMSLLTFADLPFASESRPNMKVRPGFHDVSDETSRKRRRLTTPIHESDSENHQEHEHSQGLPKNPPGDASSAEKSVAPFLARHLRDHYTQTTFNKTDQSSSEQNISTSTDNLHDDISDGPVKVENKSEKPVKINSRSYTFSSSFTPSPNSRYCYRHNPELKCRRQADEKTMDELQRVLHTLPLGDQETMAHFWSLFSAAPVKHRNLMLQGILSQCCFPQLSYLAGVINDLIRIDFLVTLPNEISFQILSYLDTASLCKAAQVSRAWKELADDDVVWHRMCEQHIDRKCKKCGWGLPLLERKRLRDSKKAMELRATGDSNHAGHHDRQWQRREQRSATAESETTTVVPTPKTPTSDQTDSGTVSTTSAVNPALRVPRPTSGGEVARCTDDEYYKCRYRPWKDVYRDRFKVGINWKHGRYTTRIFRGHTNAVMCLQFCDVANILATGSYDATIKIWDLETGEELRTLRGHAAGIRCLQFDDRKLISGSLDRCIKVWNWRTGDCISTFTGHQGGVVSLHFDSTILLSGSMDSTVKIWNFEDRSVRNFKGHTDWVNSVRVDTPSRTVFTASDDLTAKLWDLDTGSVIQTFVGHVGQVQQILPLPREFEFEEHDAECNYVNNNDDSRSMASNRSSHSHMSHGSAANLAAASPEYAALFLQDCCRPDHENCSRRPEPPRYVLTAALDSIMRLWHVPTGRCLRTFFGHIEGIWSMGADTLRLVSGSEDQTAKVWDPRTGMCERTFTGHMGPVTCVGLSDERFATGSEDAEVRVYDFRCSKSESP